MADFNQTLHDKLTHHALQLERLKAGAFKRYIPILNKIDAVIVGLMALSYGGTMKQKRDFVVKVRELKTKVYADFEKKLLAELELLATRQSSFTLEAITGMLADSMMTKPKPVNVGTIEARGSKISDQIKHLRDTDIRNTIIAARSAEADALTLKEATTRLKGANRKRQAQARAVIATTIAAVTSRADNTVFKANSDIIKGVKLSVVFDNRTTPICIQHSIDDILYPVDDYPMPGFHWNCRTRAIPVVKSWANLGANMKRKVPVRQRVSMTGSIPETTTYAGWLKTQPKWIIEDALGKTRAKLFTGGKYKLDKFIDPTGKFYDLDDLFN